MKFNQALSKEDFKHHREDLEEIFSYEEKDVRVINTANVFKCIKIFKTTFAEEILLCEKNDSEDLCPYCKDSLEIVHLSYYKKTLGKCNNCGFIKQVE